MVRAALALDDSCSRLACLSHALYLSHSRSCLDASTNSAATLWLFAERVRARHDYDDVTDADGEPDGSEGKGAGAASKRVPLSLYPRSIYGPCIEAALTQHPFRPI